MQSSPFEPISQDRLFLWGRIVRAHGLRGHVIAESFSEEPDRYDLRAFWILSGDTGIPHRVASIVAHAGGAPSERTDKARRWWRLRFTGVEDRSSAERLIRTELYLPRTYLPALPEGHFYYIEALNARVVDQNGIVRGTLRSIQPGPAYDFFVVENESGAVFWIPAPFIRQMDRSTHPPTLFMEGPEGLWDPSLAEGRP